MLIFSFLSLFFSVINREKFGLYHVDFKSPTRTRTPKDSAKVFAHIVKTHMVDWNFNPEPAVFAQPRLAESSSPSIFTFISPVIIAIALCINFCL